MALGVGLGFGDPGTQGQTPLAVQLALRIGELEAKWEGQFARGQNSGPDGGSAIVVAGGVVLAPSDKSGATQAPMRSATRQHICAGYLGSIPKLGLGDIVGR